jgi:hypothetical protein
MGLSLRNIKKSIGDVLGGVERQVNPFDNGATFSQPAPPPPSVAQNTAANRSFASKALQFGPSALGQAVQSSIVQPTARGFVQLGRSVHPEVYNQPLKPTGLVGRNLFGAEPIKTVQQQYAVDKAKHGVLPAIGLTAATVASDLPVGPGKTKVVLGKSADVALHLPVKSVNAGIPRVPSRFDKTWQTVNGIISQHGAGGTEIAKRNTVARSANEIGQQEFLNKIPTVNNLKKNDFTTFVQGLDDLDKGKKINVSPKIKQAIGEWNSAIPSIRDRAVKAGLDVGDLGPNYFPRQYKDLFSSDKAMGKLAQQLVDTGKAKTLGEAIGQLQYMRNEYQRPFGNLEKTRHIDLPGYEQTHEALGNYINRSFDRITKAEQFGPKNETLNKLLATAQQEGYNATPDSTLGKYVNIALGNTDKTTTGHKVSAGIRKFNALRSLSTAGISNATQLANTATVAGIGRTAKGIAKLATSSQARAEAEQTGVLLDHALSNLSAGGLGVTGKITRNIASPFFRTVEKFNRQATAIVGKDYGNKLAKQGDIKQLRDKFGVTGTIGKQLTRDQEIQVSRKLVELSQFKVDPMDLPGWVDSPLGKLAAQFRTFGYKQTDFMYNQVLREATKGNFLPLARFVAIAAPAGYAALEVKGKIKGASSINPEDSNKVRAVKGLSQTGGFGLPGTEGLNVYNSVKFKNTPGAIAGSVGGPTASFGLETYDNLRQGQQGKGWRKLEKQAVRSVPAVGPSIANRVFPPLVYQPDENKKIAAANNLSTVQQLKDSKPQGYNLQQAIDSNGNKKYAYTLDDGKVRTTESLVTAREIIFRDTFQKSDKQEIVRGDKHYYKDSNGKVHTATIKTKTAKAKSTGSSTRKVSSKKSSGSRSGSAPQSRIKLSKGSTSAPKVSVRKGGLKSTLKTVSAPKLAKAKVSLTKSKV